MTLGELIATLEATPDGPVGCGFAYAHSYRGDYEDLAFEPRALTTVSAMLREAKDALGKTFQGYKGGHFTMDEHTSVWLAWYGQCGEELGPTLLSFMLTGHGPAGYGTED